MGIEFRHVRVGDEGEGGSRAQEELHTQAELPDQKVKMKSESEEAKFKLGNCCSRHVVRPHCCWGQSTLHTRAHNTVLGRIIR
jgi:hypothetical protein